MSTPQTTLTHSQKILTVIGVLLGMLLAALDQTIVSTAGPAIQVDLKIEAGLYPWLTTSYLVASTVMVPIYGKLSDLFGRRRILLTGIGIFLLGSVACGVSQTALQLIAARALQGLGSAALFTSALAVIADIFAPAERGKWQGLFGAVFGLSSVIGPLIGGFITDTWGWHWVFFVNLPVGAIAVAFIVAKMPPLLPPAGRPPPSIDLAGALLLAVFAVPLLVALTLGRTEGSPQPGGYPWVSKEILGLFATSAVGLVAFLLVERRAKEPIVPLGLFHDRAFAIGNFASFLSGSVFLASVVFLPLFMVNVVGLSATSAGLTTIPLTFGIITGNVGSGVLVSKLHRYKAILLASIGILIASFVVMGFTISADTTQLEISWRMVLVGLGLGPALPLYTLAIQTSVPPAQIGVATSAATFSRQMGATIGIAVMGTVFASALGTQMATRLAEATADVPSALRERFAAAPATGANVEEGAQLQQFPRAQIEERMRAEFAGQRKLLQAALVDGDAAAAGTLANDPRTGDRLRALLPGGKSAEGIRVPFEVLKSKLLAAAQAGDASMYDTVAAEPIVAAMLAQDPSLAADRALLASKDPNAVGQLVVALDRAASEALKAARTAAFEGASGALAAAETQAITAVGKVDRALKDAFAEALAATYRWAILLALMGLVATALMPEVPLRAGARLEAVGE